MPILSWPPHMAASMSAGLFPRPKLSPSIITVGARTGSAPHFHKMDAVAAAIAGDTSLEAPLANLAEGIGDEPDAGSVAQRPSRRITCPTFVLPVRGTRQRRLPAGPAQIVNQALAPAGGQTVRSRLRRRAGKQARAARCLEHIHAISFKSAMGSPGRSTPPWTTDA